MRKAEQVTRKRQLGDGRRKIARFCCLSAFRSNFRFLSIIAIHILKAYLFLKYLNEKHKSLYSIGLEEHYNWRKKRQANGDQRKTTRGTFQCTRKTLESDERFSTTINDGNQQGNNIIQNQLTTGFHSILTGDIRCLSIAYDVIVYLFDSLIEKENKMHH